MVGVPGKSKGCNTCRRRKKGCDQKRPVCGQCASTGYICGGYQRDLSFIIHPSSKTVENAYFLPRQAQSVSLAGVPSLDRTAVDAQCRALFWDLYLPHGIAEADEGMLQRCKHPPNWTSIILELSEDEPALDQAFSAFSISRVGRSNQDLRLVRESTKLYGRALKYLQKALNDPSRNQTEEVLAACSLLGLYETFEGGNTISKSIGWLSHAQGAARLLEMRGPRQHIRRQPHHIFLGARLPIIYSAILRRSRTFLAHTDWLTIPWQNVPTKTYHDKLVDHATKVPGLLEDFDRLRTSPSSNSRSKLTELLETCNNLKDTITTWEHGKKQLARPVLVKHEQRYGDAYPFDHEMSWENHLFLNSSLVYWSVLLVLSVTLSQIELYLASLGFPTPSVYAATTFHQQQARQFATCIVQSIPYCLMPDMGALGVNHLNFPICLAFAHFTETNEKEICAWLVQVCNEIREQGIRMRSFDNPLIANQSRDPCYSGSPVDSIINDLVTGVALTRTAESNEGDTEWLSSASSTQNGSSFKSTFIYENPAKYYIDTTRTG